MADVPLLNINITGQNSIDDADKKVGKLGKTTNKTQTEIQKLRKELMSAKSDLLKAEEGTDAYSNALARASAASFKLKDANDKIRLGVKDFGQTARNVAGAVSGLAGGFTATMGVMGLFAGENENLAKAILGVQSALAVTQGLVTFADSFENMRDLWIGLKSSITAGKGVVSEIGNAAEKSAGQIGNMAKESSVLASNLAGSAGVQQTFTKEMNKLTESQAQYYKNLDRLRKVSYIAGTTGQPSMEDAEKYEKNIQKANSEISKLENSTNKAAKATTSFASNIGKSLLSMGAFLAIIAAVTYGISLLIEYLNKVPEKTKVSIEIESTALEALKKDLVDVNKFINDWRKAVYEGNKDRIKELSEYAKQEFNFNDKKLADIKTLAEEEKRMSKSKEDFINNYKVTQWKKQFEDYLKLAEDTYWNEAIIKQKVEAQIASQTSLQAAQKLFKGASSTGNFKGTITIGPTETRTWDQLVNMANNGSLSEAAYEGMFVYGIPQQIIDELRKVNAANAIIKNLPKLRDIDFNLKAKPIGGAGGSSSNIKKNITFNTELLKPTPKLIEEENFIWKEFTRRQKTNVEQAQQEVSQLFAGLKGYKMFLGPNQFDLIDADIKLLNAAMKDNYTEFERNNRIIEQNVVARNSFIEKNKQQKVVTGELNKLYQDEFNIEEELRKIPSTDKKKIAEKQKEYADTKQKIAAKEKELAQLKEEIKGLQEGTAEYEAAYSKIIDLQIERDKTEEALADKRRQRWNEELNMVKDYISALSSLAGGVSDYYQGSMDLTNRDYDNKVWAAEEYITNEDLKNKRLYEIEMERYNALYEDFENQKKFKEAQAWMDFASGSVGIWTAPGITSLAPFGYILAGIQQAALLASTIGNVNTIRAQQLDKPHKPSSSSGGGASSSGFNVALSPNQNALTSKEENLNKINKQNISELNNQKVLVSDINKVQKKVNVREQNSTY